MQPGEDYITAMYVIEFALSVIPWVLIDFREKSFLVLTLLACYMIIFAQPWANDLLNITLDSGMFRAGWLSMASYGFGVMILVLCLLFMQTKNFNSEIENEKLIENINQKNDEMQHQQEELQKNLEEVQRAREQEEKQSWATNGIAKITEILRRGDDERVYNDLLSAIVKYLNANQGGLYLAEEDETGTEYLELVACFAYDREKFVTKRIEVGQGLVGQSYLESEPIVLKEIPEDYITITSGLGEATPTFISITPLKYETTLAGVLEIALFEELEPYQLEFINRLGETIASFVSNNKLSIQTKHLLEQSQEQMGQLRAQEEEMRQNMEELQATQEEMHRKEKEYIERISELENQTVADNTNS